MIEVPQALEDAAWDAARAELGDAPLADAALARAVVDRSARYTSERDKLAAPSDARGDLAARATFFTVADAMKIAVPLGELAARAAISTRSPLRVIDVGAGCGAMTLGALAALPGRDLAVIALDRDAAALRIAGRAVARVRRRARRRGDPRRRRARARAPAARRRSRRDRQRAQRAPRRRGARGDWSTAALAAPRRRRRGRDRRARAARHHARAPRAARRAARARRRARVRAVHAQRRAVPGARRSARLVPRGPRRLAAARARASSRAARTCATAGCSFAYLVLRRSPLSLVEAGGAAWRVVSAPRPGKGKLELAGCCDAGRVTLRLLRRHRSDANAAFERADRGDVLEIVPGGAGGAAIDAPAADDRVEIVADTRVTRRTT